MPRPKRPRCIMAEPAVNRFGPEEQAPCGDIFLSLEEFEALRLIDYDGLDQSGAADAMGVSRQTVGRILKAGRLKLVSALVEGKRLTMSGGSYRVGGPGHGRGRCGRGRGRTRQQPIE